MNKFILLGLLVSLTGCSLLSQPNQTQPNTQAAESTNPPERSTQDPKQLLSQLDTSQTCTWTNFSKQSQTDYQATFYSANGQYRINIDVYGIQGDVVSSVNFISQNGDLTAWSDPIVRLTTLDPSLIDSTDPESDGIYDEYLYTIFQPTKNLNCQVGEPNSDLFIIPPPSPTTQPAAPPTNPAPNNN